MSEIEYKVTMEYDGTIKWRLNGIFHCEHGPAVESEDGYKSWWNNGERHNSNGPAVIHANGSKEWWVNGELLTEEEFIKATSKPTPKVMTVADIEEELGYNIKIVAEK